MNVIDHNTETEFSESTLTQWREEVQKRREFLFHRNWKNKRPNPQLKSRIQEKNFKFVLEWYDEFSEVMAKEKEKTRLDRLIAKGLNVNDPDNQNA